MRVVHYAPFSPSRAGIYEAARDMAFADAIQGHDIMFVDAGTSKDTGGERSYAEPGTTDPRTSRLGDQDVALKVVSPYDPDVLSADVLVCHTGIPDHWVVGNQAPMVWVIHGRPLSCFRSEQNSPNGNDIVCYRLVGELANKWPRSKFLIHFWPEFKPYWDVMIPEEKHIVFDFPPIDGVRFSNLGPLMDCFAADRGRYNGLICDSWRNDVDIFEIANGAIQAAKEIPGLKWHIVGMESDMINDVPRIRLCWEVLIDKLRKMGALGQLHGRLPDMAQVYRSVDFVLTPHKIVTRIIGEALSCGTPVVASQGCKVTPYLHIPDDPMSVACAVRQCVDDIERRPKIVQAKCLRVADNFNLLSFGEKMAKVYERAIDGKSGTPLIPEAVAARLNGQLDSADPLGLAHV